MFLWRPEVYNKYLPLYSPLAFCESGSHGIWNLPILLANEAQDLLVSQPRVLNLTHMLRQVFT